MIMSGFLLFGASQKNRVICIAFLIITFFYLYVTSLLNVFFFVNIAVILLLSLALRRLGVQIVSGASILIYSVIIDIICFYFFPLFPINVSLYSYIWSGIIFNMRAALPVVIFAFLLQAAEAVVFFRERNKDKRNPPVLDFYKADL